MKGKKRRATGGNGAPGEGTGAGMRVALANKPKVVESEGKQRADGIACGREPSRRGGKGKGD